MYPFDELFFYSIKPVQWCSQEWLQYGSNDMRKYLWLHIMWPRSIMSNIFANPEHMADLFIEKAPPFMTQQLLLMKSWMPFFNTSSGETEVKWLMYQLGINCSLSSNLFVWSVAWSLMVADITQWHSHYPYREGDVPACNAASPVLLQGIVCWRNWHTLIVSLYPHLLEGIQLFLVMLSTLLLMRIWII